jgi:hypothetical protein
MSLAGFSIFSTQTACLDIINERGQMQMGNRRFMLPFIFYVGFSKVVNTVFSGLWNSTTNVLIESVIFLGIVRVSFSQPV